jgi:hypothetical protein
MLQVTGRPVAPMASKVRCVAVPIRTFMLPIMFSLFFLSPVVLTVDKRRDVLSGRSSHPFRQPEVK